MVFSEGPFVFSLYSVASIRMANQLRHATSSISMRSYAMDGESVQRRQPQVYFAVYYIPFLVLVNRIFNWQ